jgi:hypothetical protein
MPADAHVDLDRADAVMDHIDTHPEQHAQRRWFCGTTACVAGRTALMAGWKPVFRSICGAEACRACRLIAEEVEKDGEVRYVADVARELLGLDCETADRLFAGDNTLDDIHQVHKELHGAPRQPLSWEDTDRGAVGVIWASTDGAP